MLAFSPGVFAQGRYGEEARLSIRGSGIGRGFHLRGVTLLIDSAPVNTADGSGDFQEIDPLMLSHLEVYRGANGDRKSTRLNSSHYFAPRMTSSACKQK